MVGHGRHLFLQMGSGFRWEKAVGGPRRWVGGGTRGGRELEHGMVAGWADLEGAGPWLVGQVASRRRPRWAGPGPAELGEGGVLRGRGYTGWAWPSPTEAEPLVDRDRQAGRGLEGRRQGLWVGVAWARGRGAFVGRAWPGGRDLAGAGLGRGGARSGGGAWLAGRRGAARGWRNTHSTARAEPFTVWDLGQRRVEAMQVVGGRAGVAAEQFAAVFAHAAELHVVVLLLLAAALLLVVLVVLRLPLDPLLFLEGQSAWRHLGPGPPSGRVRLPPPSRARPSTLCTSPRPCPGASAKGLHSEDSSTCPPEPSPALGRGRLGGRPAGRCRTG